MKILAILFLLAAVAFGVYFFVKISKLSKAHNVGEEHYKFTKKDLLTLLYFAFGTGFSLSLAAVFMAISKSYVITLFIILALLFGPLIFGLALTVGIGSFILYYYKLDLDKKQRGIFKILWPICFVFILVGLLIFTEGIAKNSSIYPLVSGLSFSTGWVYPGEATKGLTIKFYGVLIVSGALICYAITDHMIYQKYKKHGLIDTLFIVAFLFGILGARLWYCIVLEPTTYFNNPSVPPLYFLYGIVDGGMAIQGGAILGILAGVTFVLLFRKYIDLRYIADVAVPTILLAQVVGRWGNFFNQEVYGAATTREALWFLPTIVKNNMFIEGAYRIPLFFIEGVINLTGYFFIRYLLGKVCRFHLGLGYQASFYLVWYGMVRAILEPLRDSQFEYDNSWFIAFGMIGAGLLIFFILFIVHTLRMKKGLEDKFGNKVKKVA